MKLKISISNDDLEYRYELGATSEEGRIVAHAEHYLLLCEFIRGFRKMSELKTSQTMNEVFAKTWIAEDIERSQEIINKIKAEQEGRST